MKISFNLLRDFIKINDSIKMEDVFEKITASSAEIEEVVHCSDGISGVFVGTIKKISEHPNADRMRIKETEVSGKTYTIVCGAKNIKEGHNVPVALDGAILPGGFKITKTDKRGVESNGMLCSSEELGLIKADDGIFILDKDPINVAKIQCDKHVIKMCLETAQMLCSIFEPGIAPYKRTHYNHPCSKWIRESKDNYKWLIKHDKALCRE